MPELRVRGVAVVSGDRRPPPQPRGPRMTTPLLLARGLQLLTAHVSELERRVGGGDESAWSAYVEALQVLAALDRPERGAMLTTREMAERLGVTPKALLRRAARGEIQPAMRAGKLIRWRGSEAVAASGGQRPRQGSRGVASRVASSVARNGPRRSSEAAGRSS